MILVKTLALFLLLGIPGWAIISLAGRAAQMREGERLWLALVVGTGLASLLALVLGYITIFSVGLFLALLGFLGACLAVAAFRRAGKGAGDAPRLRGRSGLRGELLAAAVLVALGLALYAPPWRIVSGHSDVGVYPNMAANLVREGGWSVENRTATEISPENRELVYYLIGGGSQPAVYYENQFYAFEDVSTGKEWPLFFHLWPSLLAAFAAFLGLKDMFWALTWVSVLSLWGLFLLARRFLGGRWAWAAVVLAAVCPILIHFGRYTGSEGMNALLFLGGALSALLYLDLPEKAGRRSPGLAAVAGFLFFLGFLCRIDFLYVLVPLAVFFLLKGWLEGMTREDIVFIGVVGLGAVLALLAGITFAHVYFMRIWGGFRRSGGWIPVAVVGAVALAGIPGIALLRRRLPLPSARGRGWRTLRVALIWSAMAGLFAWLYFVKPLGEDRIVSYGFIKAVQGSSHRSQDFLRWSWYLSPLGLAFIFAGYALALSRRLRRGELFVVLCGLAFTLFYAFNMRALPLQILMMRRLVPVILPVGTVMAALVLKELAAAGDRLAAERLPLRTRAGKVSDRAESTEFPGRNVGGAGGQDASGEWDIRERRRSSAWAKAAGSWVLRAAAAGAFLYLVAYMAHASMPLWGLNEGGNQWEAVARAAGSVEEGATVLMDYHSGDHFGAPLRNFYGVDNAWLKEETQFDGDKLRAVLEDLGFPERGVYLLWRPALSGKRVVLPEGVRAVEAESFPVREYALERTCLDERKQRRPERRADPLEIYRLYRLEPEE